MHNPMIRPGAAWPDDVNLDEAGASASLLEDGPIPAREAAIDLDLLPGLLGYQIRQAQAALFRDFAVITERLNVTPGEFSILTLIKANPGVSQSRFASMYRVDKSTLSLSISGLVKRSLVYRTRVHVDNRFHALWLTEAGGELLLRVTEQVNVQERKMDAVLHPGERDQLLDMLARIAQALH
ncbi:MAG: MarR family winged helix-turn-helix transcriptional regulator [Acidobacteria bacterium]|jgi:DNA-binding MarR family transcriptional regulator|nr:MarR family winged helix-turn-helix transcriptional regulator [Acidobacteriota bacterium]MEB2350040.1 MarR family winged helix-turn-helix transcriptional regulator [Burkholderiaceae bacterium]